MSQASSSPRTASRTAIVDAAAELLAEHGAAAVTTRKVADAAGVQPPAIYRLFVDKDGLIDAVAEHVMATYVAAKSGAAAGAVAGSDDPVDHLRAGWRTHVEFGLANPELHALLNAPGRRDRSPATEAGIDVLRGRVRRIAAAGRLRVAEERALLMIHAAGTGAVAALLAQPAADRDLGLSDAMFGVVAAAILTDAPAAGDATLVATTIAFGAIAPELPGLTPAEQALMREWTTRAIAALQVG